jgi:hypothetical protein
MTVEPELKRVKRLLRFRPELGEQLGAGLGELHKRTALVLPASRANREPRSGGVFGQRAAVLVQEWRCLSVIDRRRSSLPV